MVSDAFAETVVKALDHLEAIAGRQIGDSARAAQAIIAAVHAEQPSLHLLLGADALRRAREKLAAPSRAIDAWETTTVGTEFGPRSPVHPSHGLRRS